MGYESQNRFNLSQPKISFEISKQHIQQLNILQSQNEYILNDVVYNVSDYTEYISHLLTRYYFKPKRTKKLNNSKVDSIYVVMIWQMYT